MTSHKNVPLVIEGGSAVDDRGILEFINDFDMSDVKRFYSVQNHDQGFVRAWHGHKYEKKYVCCIVGAAVVATVKIDSWVNPAKNLPIDKFVISSKRPSVLFVPGGYVHGYRTLTLDTKLLFFSTASLAESTDDDYRYDAYYWDAWKIVER